MGSGFGLASNETNYNPKVLPRRYMDDEAAERFNRLNSREYQAAFDKAVREGAQPVMPPTRVMPGVTLAMVRAPGGVPVGLSGP